MDYNTNNDKDVSHKYREISSARMNLLLSVFFFLFSSGMIILSYISDFSSYNENVFTFLCVSLFIFFLHKFHKNKAYIKYFYRMDLCHTTAEFIFIIVLCLLIFVLFFGNIIFLLSTAAMKEYNRGVFMERVSYLQKHIPQRVFGADNDSITEQQFAEDLFNNICNVKKAYYINVDDVKNSQFSKHEINKYNLKRYIKRPTVRGEDGMIYSLVKYVPECRYIDIEKPYSSDCVLEIDINGFKEPNNEKSDRLIFVIDRDKLIPSKVTQKLLIKKKKRL